MLRYYYMYSWKYAMLLLLLLPVVRAFAATKHPTPSRQYPAQRAAMQNLSATAYRRSVAQRQAALDILDTKDVREVMNKSCPALSKRPAHEILRRLLDELAVSELMHTFNSNATHNNEGDTDLPTMVRTYLSPFEPIPP